MKSTLGMSQDEGDNLVSDRKKSLRSSEPYYSSNKKNEKIQKNSEISIPESPENI